MRSQPFEAIGQRLRKLAGFTADDEDVEKLLLLGRIAFNLDDEWRAREKVSENQAKKTMPIAQGLAFAGLWLASVCK